MCKPASKLWRIDVCTGIQISNLIVLLLSPVNQLFPCHLHTGDVRNCHWQPCLKWLVSLLCIGRPAILQFIIYRETLVAVIPFPSLRQFTVGQCTVHIINIADNSDLFNLNLLLIIQWQRICDGNGHCHSICRSLQNRPQHRSTCFQSGDSCSGVCKFSHNQHVGV